MATVRLGIIGCGRVVQRVHLPALRAVRGATVAALADCDPVCLARAAERAPQARTFTTLDDMLSDGGIDAVLVALPSHLHASAASDALAAGKHVYVEKPLAIDLIEARSVVAAAARSDCIAMMGFNFRFHPMHRALRNDVKRGRLGRIAGARSAFCAPVRSQPEWRRSRATGGGVLLDLGSHHIDLLRFILDDDVVSVTAVLQSMRDEHDTAVLDLTLQSGTLAQLFLSSCSVDEDRIEVFGDAGRLVADRYHALVPEHRPATRPLTRGARVRAALAAAVAAPAQVAARLVAARDPSFSASLQAFVDAIIDDAPSPVAMTEGLRCLEVIAAAEQAATLRRAVALADVAEPANPS